MDAAGGGVGQGMGDAAAVTDDVQTVVLGLQAAIHLHLHIVEFHLYAVQQGVVVGGAA